MQRVPALVPVAWRGRARFAVHPLVVLPAAALGGVAVLAVQAVEDPSPDRFTALTQWVGLALALSGLWPWHPSRRPVFDVRARAITFRAPRPLGLLPLGLVVWGVGLLVDFELMRVGVVSRSGTAGLSRVPSFEWWWTLPLGLLLVCLGVYLARPTRGRSVTISAELLVIRVGDSVVALPWDRISSLEPVVGRHGRREIVVHAPGSSMRLGRGRRGAPAIIPTGLDSDPVRLWLTLQHYLNFPQHRAELGSDRSRRRRAQWRRWRPTPLDD